MRRIGAVKVPETISRKKEKERDWHRGLKEDGPAAGGPTAEGSFRRIKFVVGVRMMSD